MKNKQSLLVTICLIMLASAGCGSSKYIDDGLFESEAEIKSEPETAAADADAPKFPDYKYDQENAQRMDTESMAVSEQGFYYIIDNILFFYDIDSGLNTPLCSRVDCKHDDKDCDAYAASSDPVVDQVTGKADLSCNCYQGKLFFYDGSLYMIERTKESDFLLCRYDSRFDNRESLCMLASFSDEKEQTVVSDARAGIISDGYLYYFTSVFDPEYAKKDYMLTFQCRRVRLEKNAQPETLGEFEYASDYAMKAGDSNGLNIFIEGSDVYYIAGGTARMYTASNNVQYRVARYDTISGTFSELWSYTGSEGNEVFGKGTGEAVSVSTGNNMRMDDTGNIYILTRSKENKWNDANSIVKFNLSGQNGEIIYTTDRDGIINMRYNDGVLYFFEINDEIDEDPPVLSAIKTDGTYIAGQDMQYTQEILEREKNVRKKAGTNGTSLPPAKNILFYGIDERYILLGSKSVGFEGLSVENLGEHESIERADGALVTAGVGVLDRSVFLSGSHCEIKQVYQYKKQ